MRKRLSVILCLLFASLLGFVGCKETPYENVSIVADLEPVEVQQLYITHEYEDGIFVYKYRGFDFKVEVDGLDADADQGISVSGWEGYIREPNVEYLGNGVSRIYSSDVNLRESEIQTGKFTLHIKTKEGNKFINVDFNLDLKIEDFNLQSSALPAVTNDYQIVLNDIEGLVKLEPENTSQSDIEFSVVYPMPLDSSGGDYDINGRDDDQCVYQVNSVYDKYCDGLQLGNYKYAEVVVGSMGNQVLKVYPYLLTSTGAVATDEYNDPIPSPFPRMLISSNVNGLQGESYDVITLRARSSSNSSISDKFIDIEVIPQVSDVELTMNSQMLEEDVVVNADEDGIYNVVLGDPDYSGGILTSDDKSYFSERDLKFIVKNDNDLFDGESFEEYEVTSVNVTSDEGKPVDISMIGDRDMFKVSALTAGTYVHTFTLDHKRYKGLFTQEVKVRFKVKKIPFEIVINRNKVSYVGDTDVATSIYNYDSYPRGSYGTKMIVDSLGFDYLVLMLSEDKENLFENLSMRREANGYKAEFAVGALDEFGEVVLPSEEDEQIYTKFSSGSSFCLSHSFENLPSESSTIYIVIEYSMADESYDANTIQNHFGTRVHKFPIKLNFENGLSEIKFADTEFNINLNNSKCLYAEDEFGVTNPNDGVKVWSLPAGRTFENTIKSMSYNEDLIRVYSVRDEESNVESLYVKYVENANVDSTVLTIESYNGLVNSVKVSTYVPTIYQYGMVEGDPTTNSMPLSITPDKYSTGYLYYMSGLDNADHEAQYPIYFAIGDEINTVGLYDSVKTLFMITNARQSLKFYDYRILYNEALGETQIIPIDITAKVRVEISHSNYAKYSDGVLTTMANFTGSKDEPIRVVFTYNAGYESVGDNGQLVYTPMNIVHEMNLYIYQPLEGVEILSSKNVDLYMSDSLGYCDKIEGNNLAEHKIESTFIPSKIELGSQWNGSDEWGELGWDPVELTYEYVLDSYVLDSRGNIIEISSRKGGAPRQLKYYDIFDVYIDQKYQCVVNCRLDKGEYDANGKHYTDEDFDGIGGYNRFGGLPFNSWLSQNEYGDDLKALILKRICDQNVQFSVNVYIHQFNKLQNINTVKFSAKYASKIEAFDLDVDEDGVYFEVRNNELSSKGEIAISYTISNAEVVNKNLIIVKNDKNKSYTTRIVSNPTGNSGKIYITPNRNAEPGVYDIVVTTEDNIKSNTQGLYEYYNETTLIKSFKVRVANGSANYPFAISSAEDYIKMLSEVNEGNYYHYVLTRDINLEGKTINSPDIVNVYNSENKLKKFSLSGKYTYKNNNIEITRYSSIYNLEIEQSINRLTKDINIGLFGSIDSCVTLDNITIKNSRIVVTDNTSNDDYKVNIGLLAGQVNGAKINNCSVSGTIDVLCCGADSSVDFVVGGMVGSALQETKISGLPDAYRDGIAYTGTNAYVDINVMPVNSNLLVDNDFNAIGGLVGAVKGVTLENLQVICGIVSSVRANIGGLVGVVLTESTINNVEISPSIVINLAVPNADETTMNVGGVVGLVDNAVSYSLSNAVVYFVDINDGKLTYTWQDKVNIFVSVYSNVKVYVGGLVGEEQGIANKFEYNYVRSYYDSAIGDDYKGNIYVVAGSGSAIGGLIGKSNAGSKITNSYFDADITASEESYKGMIVGDIELTSAYTISNSYAVGLLTNLKGDKAVAVDNIIGKTTKINEQVVVANSQNAGIFGNIAFGDPLPDADGNPLPDEDIFGDDISHYLYEKSNLIASQTYAVINGHVNYFANVGKIYGVNSLDDGKPVKLSAKVGDLYVFFKDTLKYNITNDGKNVDTSNWYYNSNLNIAKIDTTKEAYPVLLNGNNLMFDIIPSSIGVKIIEREGLYDVKAEEYYQVVMYINRNSNGVADNTFYEFGISENADLQILVNGTVQDGSSNNINLPEFKYSQKLEFEESSGGKIIRLDGNRVYPVSTGVATLTIRSFVAKNIEANITILVVDGITDTYLIANDEQEEVQPVDEFFDNASTIYIDEQSTFSLEVINKDYSYISNAKYGFVLEFLEGTTGVVRINGKDYSYISDENKFEENILVFSGKTFNISGKTFGDVKFTLTPYIMLDGISYLDTYTSIGNNSVTKSIANAYILDNIDIHGALQKTYAFNVLARAKSIENTRKEISLDSNNIGTFKTILETPNVLINEIQDENSHEVIAVQVSILEDLYLRINNNYSTIINLKDIEKFDCEKVDNEYRCTGLDFKLDRLKYFVDYNVMDIVFTDMTIFKTNVDTQSRENTYKIVLSGTVTFDRDYYRANANQYDLNSASFEFVMTPETNPLLSSSTLVKFVPSDITKIYTDFYTKAEGSFESDYIENPEENESNFIVPGRDGLLKITLNEEFNNSSYVTLMLSKKYYGLVQLEQVAAVVDAPINDMSTGEIVGYTKLRSLEEISTDTHFGIKLSKLSLNYNDKHYFNNTYYIRLLVNEDINYNTLDIELSSYKIDTYTQDVGLQVKTIRSLDIMELPEIKATADSSDYAVIGRGVRKQLDIEFRGLTHDINVKIEAISDFVGIVEDYVYITEEADEFGEYRRVQQISLDYLRSGKKYYINVDVETQVGAEFRIKFSTYESILGVIEESYCNLYLDCVDFEIQDVWLTENGIDTLTLLHGQNQKFEVVIIPRAIVVGDPNVIESYVNGTGEGDLPYLLKVAQYAFAGQKVIKINNGVEEVISNHDLKLQYEVFENGNYRFKDITRLGEYGGITFTSDEYIDGIYSYKYYEIKGTSISADTHIRLNAEYYYNAGQLQVGDFSSQVYNKTIDITIVVEDNSTYDHPTPIEDQAGLLEACSVEDGNFILLNNIELEKWIPQEARFNILDGNGYTITIKSFDLSSIVSASGGDVGIFTSISESSLVKNITIDISPMLKSNIQLLNDVASLQSSTETSYSHRDDIIDLAYVSNVNFGILAGTNNGSITNAKVINLNNNLTSERKYFHILTSQGSAYTTNIGGLVGVNATNGAITNSYVGVSVSGVDGQNYYITGVKNPSLTPLNNENDELEKIAVYPFVIAGGNNIGGLVCENNGIITNCYSKGLGVYNTNRTVETSATAGLVTFNKNIMTSTFVEGSEISGFRAVDNDYRIESTGFIGGLVYENSATIENSYANVYVQTLSSFLGGFLFRNTENAQVINSYSTSVNRNSLATGQFTGVKQGVTQNFGQYINCYYLVDASQGEFANVNEQAIEISNADNYFDDEKIWNGFSFITGANADGIWEIEKGDTPKISTTKTETISFRRLTDVTVDFDDTGVVYEYTYDTYYLGSKENPLIIDKAENFDKYIIDNSQKISGTDSNRVFGFSQFDSAVRYVRLVNNLNFENITIAQKHEDTYLYKIIFAGHLDGNGMSLSNLNINTNDTDLENFGLFAQVGHEDANYISVIKNLNITVRTYSSSNNSKAGILAGTIVNSSIVNVKIDGGERVVSGSNMAGALAGFIYNTNDLTVSLRDITIENVEIASAYGSLGGSIYDGSEDKSIYFFDSFSVVNEGQQSQTARSFTSLYDSERKQTILKEVVDSQIINYVDKVSYAGGVAGVVLANNYNKLDINNITKIDNYRTKPYESSIDNLVVRGNVQITNTDNAGGLFGYVGENTLVRNSKLVVSDTQLLKGSNNIGGIVGENHGIIEKCTVAYDDKTQETYDATILNNDRGNGTFNLFDMSQGESYYTVSIGGIAGLSENGVIIDSYSKVNVTKKLAFIAGGIVGYAKANNYLGYVYNTGAVYGKYITGGVVGLQVGDYLNNIQTRVHMDNVVSLTNWNAQANLNKADEVNKPAVIARNEITKTLYDAQKIIYAKTDDVGYNNFYIKMPEIGNAPIDSSGSAQYRTVHNNYYVGSVVGKAILKNHGGGTDIYNGAEDNYHVFANSDVLNGESGLYASNIVNNVFSTTLGLVSASGSVENGSREHLYTSSFTVTNGEENITAIYRIAYSTDLNSYEAIDSDSTLDKMSYPRVFTTQEYIQQLLGDSYVKDTEQKTCKTTQNIFKFGATLSDRYSTILDVDGSFVDDNANVWEVGNLLPNFSTSISGAISKIDNAEKLAQAFANTTAGQTYQIVDDITLNISDTNVAVKYYGSQKSLFVGANKDENGGNVQITINLADDASETSVATIFKSLDGAIFQNIDFVINVTKGNYTNSNIEDENYGLFANTLENVQILNCNFTLNITNNVEFDISNSTVDPIFKAVNTGLLFGAVNNTTIKNSSFNINTNGKNISLNYMTINNFGLVAGISSKSTITNCSFEITDTELTINETSPEINIGGLIGSSYSTIVSKVGFVTPKTLIVTDNSSEENVKSIGAMFGFANNLSLSNVAKDMDDFSSTITSLQYNNISSQVTTELNVALVVAKAEASRVNDVVVSDKSTLNVVGNTVNTLNAGTIIGYNVLNSQAGKSGVVGSYSPITTLLNAKELNVGGLVGKSGMSSLLLKNAFSDSDITITNSLTTDVTSYVGGLVGFVSGGVSLEDIASISDVDVAIADTELSASSRKASLGGLIGGSSNNVNISNFTSIGTLTLNRTDYETNKYSTYMSGVVGHNMGTFIGKNGCSYVELPRSNYVDGGGMSVLTTICSAITNGTKSKCDNVYYAQEFIGNNYSNEVAFTGYAMADLYDSISESSSIYALLSDDMVEYQSILVNSDTYMSIVLPKAIAEGNYISRDYRGVGVGTNKFNPYEITIANRDLKTYNIILNDLVGFGGFSSNDGKIVAGQIVSGRSVEDGKVVVSLSGNTLATINSGVLSNIYLETSKGEAVEVSLVDTNNGLITNCYIYGLTKLDYTLARINNAFIYQSASSVGFITASATANNELYGLVFTNNTTGYISDCYSASFGYVQTKPYKTNVYGFANENKGVIVNSTYFIPSEISYENIKKSYVKSNTGTINYCYGSESPSALFNRSKVWTSENGHAQLVGFKDKENIIVIKVLIGVVGEQGVSELEDVQSVSELKDKISTYVENGKEYVISYDYEFYSTETSRPDYNVVRISSGSEFTNYMSSLLNGYMINTIALLVNDSNSDLVLNIDASDLYRISLDSSSAIIGVNATGNNSLKITLDFGVYRNSQLESRSTINSSLFGTNNGIIAGFAIKNLQVRNLSSEQMFAPIMTNTGIIDRLDLDEVVVSGVGITYVSGLVATNASSGMISNSFVTHMYVYSAKWASKICANNNGKIVNTECGIITYTGDLYVPGN